MIITEEYQDKFKKTYSSEGYYIQKKGTDEKYVDAIDLKDLNFEYIETNELIEESD